MNREEILEYIQYRASGIGQAKDYTYKKFYEEMLALHAIETEVYTPEAINEALSLFNGYWANDYTVCDEIAYKYKYNKKRFTSAVYKRAKEVEALQKIKSKKN